MDSEKPRFVSIPAETAVVSDKPRVSISAVTAADAFLLTRNLSGSFSSGSFPIRAPLTVDDDDDSGSLTDEHNSASSDASNYSRELGSGTDDGFESVSGDAEDEPALEDVIMGGIRVHRLLGEGLGGEIGDGSDFSGGSVIYRPFAGDMDEETSVNYSSLEEESENSDEVDGVSESEVSEADSVSVKAKVVIPRAILSVDDDEILGSDGENAALLSVTKAPDDEQTQVEDRRTLQFGDVGMVDEPECSDSVIGDFVSTEEEAVDYSDKFKDSLMSFGNIEDPSLGVLPGGCNDFVVENEEVSMGWPRSSKQLIEEGIAQRTIIKEDEADALMKPGNVGEEEGAVEFREIGMTDKLEYSGSVTGELVSTEDVVQMEVSNDGLVSSETILGVAPGDCNEFLLESEGHTVDADRGFSETLSQLVKQGVDQGTICKESDNRVDDGSACEADESMVLGEGSTGLRSRESGEEDIGDMRDEAQERSENDCGPVSELENPEYEGEPETGTSSKSFQVAPTLNSVTMRNLEVAGGVDVVVSGCGCSDQKVEQESENENEESEDVDRILLLPDEDNNKVSDNTVDDGSACEADESIILTEGPIGLRSRESGDEDTGNMVDEAQERCENDSGAVSELEKPECEGKPEIGMSSESFQSTPTLNSVMLRNLEVAGEVDIIVSGCGCSDQKAEQESENEGNQESDEIDRNLSLPDEDGASCLSSSERANETKQVNFLSDSEPNQISGGIEETSLVSVKDVERTVPRNSSVIAYDMMDNETQMARLIHDHTSMELDEYKATGDTSKKQSESTFQNGSEELSSDHSVQLISERVKERVEKTLLLKAQIQKIIRKTNLCSENSAVTEVESKLSLAGGEHQTSFGLDYVSDRTKIMLPGQEFQDDLDFSINVLVLGKTGVGKSATVNSIFGETKSPVGAFGVTTKTANYIVGNVGGILVRLLDTPGLKSSATEGRFNQEVLMSIKKSMRTFPVDVVLYISRLDEHPDTHLLRIITSSLGSSIWRNTIVVLTHAASNVSDSSSYKDFIAQRSSLMQQSIREAVPEQSKMPGIVLAENNMSSFCGNETKESTTFVDWRLNLVMLCCSVKMMRSKADSLEKHKAMVEKPDVYGSFTLFCSVWNALLHGANPRNAPQLHDDMDERKKRHLLDSYPEILWDEQSRETPVVKNQEPGGDDEKEKTNVVIGRVRSRRGRLGFQATKRLGIYLDTSELHTGFSIGYYRKQEEEQGKLLVRMRSSMAVLGLVPMLVSVFTCVYGRKDI